MSTISLKQKKEWSNTDLVLQTPRGVKYFPREKEKMDSEYIVVEGPGNYHCGYSLSAEEGYLSYKRYHFPNVWRVADWNTAIANKQAVLSHSSVIGYFREFLTDSEIRFYPSNSFIVLFQGHKDDILKNIVLDNITKDEIKEDIITITPVDWQNCSLYAKNHFLYLQSEEDVQKHLQTLKSSEASKFANMFFSRADSDLCLRVIQNPNAYETIKWSWRSKTQLDEILKTYDHKYKCNYAAKKCGSDLQMAFDIPFYISASDAPTTAAINKADTAEKLIAPVKEEWEHADSKTMYWYRCEDYICVIAPGTQSRSGYGYDNQEKKFLAYNVKTKKRLYGVKDHRGAWTFPIPSSKYINEAMATALDKDTATSGSGYYSHDKRGATSSVIKGGLTVRELFEGTNVAWFLDHAEDDKVYFQNVSLYDHSSAECKYNTTPTKQLFRTDYIDTLAIIMLCTTGTPLLEQLLKSSLFNLYFTGIEDLMEDGYCFITKTKYEKRSYHYPASSFVYDEKGKNLKQMFGVSLNFLRSLDKAKEIQKIEEDTPYSSTAKTGISYKRPHLNLGNIKSVFGDAINSLDQKTIDLLLTIANEEQVRKNVIKEKSSRYLPIYSDGMWTQAKALFETLPDCNIKQKLTYLQKYQPTLNLFADYMRMRKTVQNIQALTPEMPWIFSEKIYPTKIGCAKKFIPYTESERRKCESGTRGYYYRKTSLPAVHPQVEYYNQKYFIDYYSKDWSPNVTECLDDEGNHIGVILTLNTAAHLDYLHDQITFWFDFYKDANQNKLFMNAVKRVKGLEWTDKTSGLEIVAPTCVEDLQQEGTELSHCVSSFVQPIIDGSTNVVFIRRSDMKETPYYTVEVVNGEIRQVHCYRNGGLNEAEQKRAFINSGSPVYNKIFDIVGFLKRWAHNSGGAISEKSIKGSYGTLAAAH